MSIDPDSAEIARIRLEYERRDKQISPDMYGLHRPANQFWQFQTARAAIEGLTAAGMFPLADKVVADIGCGKGTWLLEFAQWGSKASQLYGIDLDESRISDAEQKLPGANLIAGDARSLPWPDGHFDLVSQFTLFTSILSAQVKAAIAQEMFRVVKPGGAILWYDFRVNNPANPNVRGIERQEIESLFPGCTAVLDRVTLAPPIARRIVPHSWVAALLLEKLPVLCTHYLGIIRKT